MKNPLQLKRAGAALPLVLLAVVILLAMGVGLLNLGLNSRIFAIRTSSGIAARCAADAGLTKAVFEMKEKLKVMPWDESTLPVATGESLPNCDATFSYTVTGGDDGVYAIESIGKSGRAEKTVHATVELRGLFEYAVLSQGSIILKSDTLIDGYNSLDPDDTDVEVRIGTTSILPDQIIISNGVTIDGEVLVGIDGDPDTVIKDLGGTTGDRYAMIEEPTFPEITPPILPDMGTDIYVKGNILNINPASSGKYTAVNVLRAGSMKHPRPATLIVSGGDVVLHVTGDILVGQLCEIQVKNNASFTIYSDGDITFGESSGVDNQTGTAGSFKLYSTGVPVQDWDIRAKSDIFGAIYAPNADIIVYAEGDIGASIVANNLEFKAGGNFYYDEALREISANDEGVRFVVKHWSE